MSLHDDLVPAAVSIIELSESVLDAASGKMELSSTGAKAAGDLGVGETSGSEASVLNVPKIDHKKSGGSITEVDCRDVPGAIGIPKAGSVSSDIDMIYPNPYPNPNPNPNPNTNPNPNPNPKVSSDIDMISPGIQVLSYSTGSKPSTIINSIQVTTPTLTP